MGEWITESVKLTCFTILVWFLPCSGDRRSEGVDVGNDSVCSFKHDQGIGAAVPPGKYSRRENYFSSYMYISTIDQVWKRKLKTYLHDCSFTQFWGGWINIFLPACKYDRGRINKFVFSLKDGRVKLSVLFSL